MKQEYQSTLRIKLKRPIIPQITTNISLTSWAYNSLICGSQSLGRHHFCYGLNVAETGTQSLGKQHFSC